MFSDLFTLGSYNGSLALPVRTAVLFVMLGALPPNFLLYQYHKNIRSAAVAEYSYNLGIERGMVVQSTAKVGILTNPRLCTGTVYDVLPDGKVKVEWDSGVITKEHPTSLEFKNVGI